ncbi:MAG TPA: zf-TFIIB domain-containing protein [Thermodesulfobacteriota bacterium]|nr:zf-TFIIB domain-containing protein [Thermodesulfobacteriota bacterium]
MNCLNCNTELDSKVFGDLEVDECAKCKSIWFDSDELRKAKDLTDENLNWMDFEIWKHEHLFKTKSKDLPCPKCSKALVSINYADTGVTIDHCPSCKGSWLEKGEFENIIEALTNEMQSKSFSEYVSSSIEEAKEIITGPESFHSEWKDFSIVLKLLQIRLFVEKPKLIETINSIQKASPIR